MRSSLLKILGLNYVAYRPFSLANKQFQSELISAWKTLGVTDNCSREEARNAFMKWAKEYHPDSGSPNANSDKFSDLSTAYKLVIKNIKFKENASMPDIIEEEYSIEEILKETIPIAHRKYLTNDGIGYGTPSQRQKQYQAYRMNRASAMVSDYKMQKVQRETEGSNMLTVKEFAKRSKTSHFVDRVVEDLIQESMAKGEFDDTIKGGKIETPTMPYVDQHDYHLNKVLINSGYTPEWVQSKQEIKKNLEKYRDTLLQERKRFHRSSSQYSKISKERWKEKCDEFYKLIDSINKEIQLFNLITPLPKTQMLMLCPDKEFEFVQKQFEECLNSEEFRLQAKSDKNKTDDTKSLFSSLKEFLSF
uniref:dnaJ homolog subfamily C member 28-like n=1 Tax=Styela clava TaxID=7725 RepID=UPI001939E537|nr:dnaJ homolog subfamily C member 28-like [Styela clava]